MREHTRHVALLAAATTDCTLQLPAVNLHALADRNQFQRLNMPTFITIGYGDKAGYERTAPTVRDQAHAHDDRLRETGARIARAGNPTQVRNPEGRGVQLEHGTYMHSELPVAGLMLLEAKNLEHAITLAADTPCAVAHGVIEVWPLEH